MHAVARQHLHRQHPAHVYSKNRHAVMLLLLRVRAEAVHVHQRRVHRVAAGKSKSKVKVEIEGSLLYTVVILCLVQCSIGKLWRSSTILSLAWHIITN